jgi:cell wall-associated NlpC family hydrolase
MRARQANRGFRGSAGQLAQAVQRSAFPGRYDEHAQEASKLLGGGFKGTPGLSVSARLGGAQSLSGPSQGPGTDNKALTQYFLTQSNALAQTGHVDPNAMMDLLSQRQQAADAGTASNPTSAAPAGQNFPLVAGNANQKESHALGVARQYLGTWYKWGGSNPGTGFDCSGLVQYAWAKSGVKIPRTTYDQWQTGQQIDIHHLHPGDAVFFRGSDARGNLPGHVGMYIGHGQFIEAPHTGAKVRISNLRGRTDYVGARRYG